MRIASRMASLFGDPHLYWAKIFLTDCNILYKLQTGYFNKAVLGFLSAFYSKPWCEESKQLLPCKQAQSLQYLSVDIKRDSPVRKE